MLDALLVFMLVLLPLLLLLLLLLQADMYEGAHNISKLIELGPVPGVKTYCIYGEAVLQGQWPSRSNSSSSSGNTTTINISRAAGV
jgi:hypothetical protein